MWCVSVRSSYGLRRIEQFVSKMNVNSFHGLRSWHTCRNMCVCRSAKKMEKEVKAASGSGSVETGVVDLSDYRSVYDFAKQFRDSKRGINVLINNAGDCQSE